MFLSYVFPSRAAQKLNLSSKKKKHRPTSSTAEPPLFATSFSGILQTSPPPAPPCLLRAVNKVKDTPGLGKVGPSTVPAICPVCEVLDQVSGRRKRGLQCIKIRRRQGEKEATRNSFESPENCHALHTLSSKLRHANSKRTDLLLVGKISLALFDRIIAI